MEDFSTEHLDKLRKAIVWAVNSPELGINNYNNLAPLCGVGKQLIYKFMRTPKGEKSNLSFWAAARILTAIGGKIVYPQDKEGKVSLSLEGEEMKKLRKEVEEMKIKLDLMKELLFEKQSRMNKTASG